MKYNIDITVLVEAGNDVEADTVADLMCTALKTAYATGRITHTEVTPAGTRENGVK